ncbi:hypothetical protein ACFL6S_30200 [Candidatus Poribacteria bacterium]
MKLLIITALITFVVVSGLSMFLTGTFKEAPPQDQLPGELDVAEQTAEAVGENTESQEDTASESLAESQEELEQYESKISTAEAELASYEKQSAAAERKMINYESQLSAAEAKLADYGKQIDAAESKVTDYENRLSAVAEGLADSEGRLDATEGKLTSIKAGTESLGSKETSESRTQQLAKLYGSMKPKSAASILCKLEEDLSMRILAQMSSRSSGKLMDAIATENPDYAAKISRLMAKADTSGSYPKPTNN